jgi:predicted amidophosphoribosyltransferase
VWSALSYEGVVRQALGAFKEYGRTDVSSALAEVLFIPIHDAHRALTPRLPSGAELELMLAPSSAHAFRQRGYQPLKFKKLAAASVWSTLRIRGAVADQSGLGREARRDNVHGSMAVSRPLAHRHFILVDDVVTTGYTILECRRAIEAAGGTVWGAATLAYTKKFSEYPVV